MDLQCGSSNSVDNRWDQTVTSLALTAPISALMALVDPWNSFAFMLALVSIDDGYDCLVG